MKPSTVLAGCSRCGERPGAARGYSCACHPHAPIHDRWMIDASDPDYLEPAERWCIRCGKLDTEHS